MSGQLESRHFFRTGDTVEHRSGMDGEVIDAQTLYAAIRWSNGDQQEIEQFDPAVTVIQRALVG